MSGTNWVVGFHAVAAALEREPSRVEVVWLGEGVGGNRARTVLELARQAGVRFAVVPRRELDRVAEGAAHNGFAARLAPAPLADAEPLLATASPVCLLGLDGVQDPHNLGAVIRVAAAFSLGGVVVAGPHPPPLGGAAAKVAAGTLPLVRVARVGALGDFARQAQEAGFTVLGADARGEPVHRVELPDRLLLCLGGEEGLRAKTQRFLDGVVAIPIAREVESLNLAVACGILAWEWRRRWGET
ncbi:MAG: TrmH family RNA methyltransferase [Acidobacteriota bacterium]